MALFLYIAIFDCNNCDVFADCNNYVTFAECNYLTPIIHRLQHGPIQYFARAVLLAIYGDQPAATKCTLTGSACPVCVTPWKKMSPEHGFIGVMRTDATTTKRKRQLTAMAKSGLRGAATKANDQAKRIGVWPLDVKCGLRATPNRPDLWVFGPNPELDNVYQCMPQVSLHGMDEGLTAKLNYGCLMTALTEVRAVHQTNIAIVPPLKNCNF